LWVVLLDEVLVVGHLCVELVDARRGNGEELGPVGTGVEGGELFFDEWEDGLYFGPLGLPGEVDGHGGALVSHAEPEVVGCDGAEFGDEEVRGDAVPELLDGEDGFVGAVAGDEVFGLELGAAAGGEVELEVGEALVPRAGDAELIGAGFGVVVDDGVRRLTQTSEMLWFCQSVKRLTL